MSERAQPVKTYKRFKDLVKDGTVFSVGLDEKKAHGLAWALVRHADYERVVAECAQLRARVAEAEAIVRLNSDEWAVAINKREELEARAEAAELEVERLREAGVGSEP